jgi:sugar phosphate isomerase/epimerase
MRYAYNSNGLKLHSSLEAIGLLADLGYDGIELALQREHLHPFEATSEQVRAVQQALRERGLGIICGAGVPNALADERFEPTLFQPDAGGRALRLRYLQASLELAAELGAELLVSCSGLLKPGVDGAKAWAWLVDGLAETCRRAAALGLRVGIEPEPGHFVETLDDYRRLSEAVDSPSLGITADLGHLVCTEQGRPEDHFDRLLSEERLLSVQIEDIRDRQHLHLPFGEGEIEFGPVLRALASFDGFVSVELSRDSPRAAELAARSLAFLRRTTDEGRRTKDEGRRM